MRLEHLRLTNLRNIAALDVELAPGINFFGGPNGSGKTSILEGAYLLSHGRSFRSGQYDTLVRHGAEQLAVYAELQRDAGRVRLGLSRDGEQWRGRINGEASAGLADILSELAVMCFEPGSHALISGPGHERRRFLDWGVFHVEHAYWPNARRYRRALQQRNRLLKDQASPAELDVWDHELSLAAGSLERLRAEYFQPFSAELGAVLFEFLPELGEVEIDYVRGWTEGADLLDCLQQARSRDQIRGHTTQGPHRADWRIRFEQAPNREQLSRGQEKLCALACTLAQARHYAKTRGEWPILALDDLGSELDAAHQRLVAEQIGQARAQVLVTGTQIPPSLEQAGAIRMFHVERGEVRGLL